METDHALSCVVGLLQVEALPVALKHNPQVGRFRILWISQSQFDLILLTAIFMFLFFSPGFEEMKIVLYTKIITK